jgi:hypothetical protein
MQQALHIFRKDVRYLYREIALVLVAAAIFAWKDPWWVDFLFIVSAALLIGRAIHAEAIPGDRQFWITRPYRWRSLATAKVLFILIFVNVPIFIDQLIVVVRDGFPLATVGPGLLWSQLLWIFCFSLPVAALASMTSGLVPFVFCNLALVLATLSVPQMLLPGMHLLPLRRWPEMVDWVRDSAAVVALLTIALVILREQYQHRRTLFSRAFGAGAVLAAAVMYLYVPWSVAFAVQTRIAHRTSLNPSLAISFGPGPISAVPVRDRDQVQLHVPLSIEAAAQGFEVRPDAIELTFRDADGRSWYSDLWNPQIRSTVAGVTKLEASAVMPASVFDGMRKDALRLHGSIYFTLFETAAPRTVPLSDTPVDAGDGLQCYRGLLNDIHCRSLFRWPGRLIYARVFQTDLHSFFDLISYSPFPAVLDLDPVQSHWTGGGAVSDQELTLVVKKPVATFRRDLNISGIRLRAESPQPSATSTQPRR